MSLERGSTGRLLLQIVQTAGTIVATAYGGPAAGIAATAAHTAFFALYDSANQDDTINKQESLTDLRIQTSTLGQAIPQVFGGKEGGAAGVPGGGGGGGRLAGNVFWSSDKMVREHRESRDVGGKGFGGGVQQITITKTYSISMAIGLCNTHVSGPMTLVHRAWKNANLVYDVNQFLLAEWPANWTFYPGTDDQDPDTRMELDIGFGQTPGYNYLCYILMDNEDLGPSGQVPQWSFELGQAGETLTTVVTTLCNAAGLSGAALDVTGLPAVEVQMTLTSIEAIRASLEQLSFAYRFYGLESGLRYVWRQIGAGAIVATIPEADGSAGEERANDAGARLDRAQSLELPTTQYLTYIDPAQNYQRNTQPSAVVLPPSGRENPKNVTIPLSISADQARRLSTELVALSWVQREPYADVLPRKYCYLEPGDKINCEARGLTYSLVLTSTTYGAPGLLEIAGRVNGSPRLGIAQPMSSTQPVDQTLQTSTTISPGAVAPPGQQTTHVVGDTTPVLLNLPVLDSSDQAPRYHVAYVGENEPWEGGALYRSVDGSATFQTVDGGVLEAITGTVAVALPTVGDFTVRDDTTVMRVVLEYGTLTTVNDAANAAGVQRVMVGDEMLYVGTATLVATREYDCTKLWRGRQGSEWAIAAHTANETFVLLDAAVHKVSMTTAERGISYPFKSVTVGQSIADATAVNFSATAENLVPWRVTTPVASRPAQTWQTRWYQRSRFVPGGTDPDHIGFEVKIYNSAAFTTVVRTIQTSGGYAMNPTALKGYDYPPDLAVADFGAVPAVLYWTVSQVSAYAVGRSVQNTSTDFATVQGAIEPVMPGAMAWIHVTGTSESLKSNTGYIMDNPSLATGTLPMTSAIGDLIIIVGKGAGAWRIAQNASQQVHIGKKSTTVGAGGSITARHAHQSITLRCLVANLQWEAV